MGWPALMSRRAHRHWSRNPGSGGPNSQCNTRRRDPIAVVFADRCSNSGRSSNASPRPATQVSPGTTPRHCATVSASRRPCRCEPGNTSSGPSSAAHGSMCRRIAHSCRSRSSGACTYHPPSLFDQPRRPRAPKRLATGTLRSWCQPTDQFRVSDFSNKVHWMATASCGNAAAMTGWRRIRDTNATHQECARSWRVPPDREAPCTDRAMAAQV